ncbi:MFS transporter [Mesorhizobium sp. NPDC059054]|uniref:MFS transporter n=1 Tax=Mesorhizobium sp. NPDC059054 TaxID=3346711 RepID=UPI0036CDEC86
MDTLTYDRTALNERAQWGAVVSLALCVAVLIASEFMPVSLLSPIAADLAITAGQTGQAISISGIFAVITSLFVVDLTRLIDRKRVVLGFTLLLITSGLAVTFAPNYAFLMVGRSLLGVAIGGFWSMSTSIIMRLVPENDVPNGLAMLNAGNAVAATIAAPLGSFLGAYVGWRGAFFVVVPLGLLAFIWQWISLPALPSRNRQRASALQLLGRKQVTLGMGAILFFFMGQFALFTYLRPFLEGVTGLAVETLSLVLLAMGLAGVAGTWCIGQLLNGRSFSILVGIPLIMAIVAVALVACGTKPIPVSMLLLAWGFFGTAAPVGWGTWLSRTLPEDAEGGGGLQVAVIQLAITGGAALGGTLFDTVGWWAPLWLGAALLLASSVVAIAAWRNAQGTSS